MPPQANSAVFNWLQVEYVWQEGNVNLPPKPVQKHLNKLLTHKDLHSEWKASLS